MTAHVKYQCNLCKREIDDKKTKSEYPEGWALTWVGPGAAMPMLGSRLEPCRPWLDSPVHLCAICVEAVGEFYVAAQKCGEILST